MSVSMHPTVAMSTIWVALFFGRFCSPATCVSANLPHAANDEVMSNGEHPLRPLLRRAVTTETTATTGLPAPAWLPHKYSTTASNLRWAGHDEEELPSHVAALIEQQQGGQKHHHEEMLGSSAGVASSGQVHRHRRELTGRAATSDITIWCGGHHASECTACPGGHGQQWCNGDCEWKESMCNFREDLVWCGGHTAKDCNECISEAPEEELRAWCNGECEVYNNTCKGNTEVAQIQQQIAMDGLLAAEENKTGSDSKTEDDYGGLPSPTTLYYAHPQRDPLHHQEYMGFYEFGCCRTSESITNGYIGSNMGPMGPDDCMHFCLQSDVCIAADIGGPQTGSLFTGPGGAQAFGCTMYSGHGAGFKTACDPSFHCYRKIVPGTTEERSSQSPQATLLELGDTPLTEWVALEKPLQVPAMGTDGEPLPPVSIEAALINSEPTQQEALEPAPRSTVAVVQAGHPLLASSAYSPPKVAVQHESSRPQHEVQATLAKPTPAAASQQHQATAAKEVPVDRESSNPQPVEHANAAKSTPGTTSQQHQTTAAKEVPVQREGSQPQHEEHATRAKRTPAVPSQQHQATAAKEAAQSEKPLQVSAMGPDGEPLPPESFEATRAKPTPAVSSQQHQATAAKEAKAVPISRSSGLAAESKTTETQQKHEWHKVEKNAKRSADDEEPDTATMQVRRVAAAENQPEADMRDTVKAASAATSDDAAKRAGHSHRPLPTTPVARSINRQLELDVDSAGVAAVNESKDMRAAPVAAVNGSKDMLAAVNGSKDMRAARVAAVNGSNDTRKKEESNSTFWESIMNNSIANATKVNEALQLAFDALDLDIAETNLTREDVEATLTAMLNMGATTDTLHGALQMLKDMAGENVTSGIHAWEERNGSNGSNATGIALAKANSTGNGDGGGRREFNFFSTSAPPESPPSVVQQQVTVQNIDYDSLVSDDALLSDFKARTKTIIANSAGSGVTVGDVALKLSKGSVKIVANIKAPANAKSETVLPIIMDTLAEDTTFPDILAGSISQIPGIDAIKTGPISCTDLGTAEIATTTMAVLPDEFRSTTSAPNDTTTVETVSEADNASIQTGATESIDEAQKAPKAHMNDDASEAGVGDDNATAVVFWKIFVLVVCLISIVIIGFAVFLATKMGPKDPETVNIHESRASQDRTTTANAVGIIVSMVVQHVNVEELHKNSQLCETLNKIVIAAMVVEAGPAAGTPTVEIIPGVTSMLKLRLKPCSQATTKELKHKLGTAKEQLSHKLLAAIKTCEGIQTVTTGEISIQDLKVNLEILVPASLEVAGSDTYDGKYNVTEGIWLATVAPGQAPGGYPLWKSATSDYWLFSGKSGRWFIGDQEEAKLQFNTDTGNVATSTTHQGKMPHEIAEGTWQRYDKASQVWTTEPKIRITQQGEPVNFAQPE